MQETIAFIDKIMKILFVIIFLLIIGIAYAVSLQFSNRAMAVEFCEEKNFEYESWNHSSWLFDGADEIACWQETNDSAKLIEYKKINGNWKQVIE